MISPTKNTVVIVVLVLILLLILSGGVLFIFINKSNQQIIADLKSEVEMLNESVQSLESKVSDLEKSEDVVQEDELIVEDADESNCIKNKDYDSNAIYGDECFVSAGKDLFESSKYGFSFEYPSDWHVNDEDGITFISNEDIDHPLEASGNDWVGIFVKVFSNPNQMSTKEYMDAQSTPGIEYHDEKRIVMHGVVNAIQRVKDTRKVDGIETSYGIATYTAFTDNIYVIEGFSNDDKIFERYKQSYLDLVDSFKFD